MRLKSLKISNILSFKYCEDLSTCSSIEFKNGLNIFIGTNGSGKTTMLEIINCTLTRVFFQGYSFNEKSANKKETIRRGGNHNSYQGLRLHRNRITKDNESKFMVEIELDDIDKQNIQKLINNKQQLKAIAENFSELGNLVDVIPQAYNQAQSNVVTVTAILNQDQNKSIQVTSAESSSFEFQYLRDFEFYKYLIDLHNKENPTVIVEQLTDTFATLGGYRNYNLVGQNISLSAKSANQQRESLKEASKQKSLNEVSQNEPEIFGIVRASLAGKHYEVSDDAKTPEARLEEANNQDFIKKINSKLRIINLKLEIAFVAKASWSYQFKIIETLTNTPIEDISHLSSGQKAVLHLILESYGREAIKGGLIIIDEPELHLHYQFQHEFLKVVEGLIKELKTQYVFVTHSESLINSQTIESVTRLALNSSGETAIYSPTIQTDDRWLVKILDNSRSIHAFFGDKVLLVEGEDDRYFFQEVINLVYSEKRQYISVLNIEGKGKFDNWKIFFGRFGLKVYTILDLDYAFKLYEEADYKLHGNSVEATKGLIQGFRCIHADLDAKIEGKYIDDIFILKHGALEEYLEIHNKGITEVIKFCDISLESFETDASNALYGDLKKILNQIMS